MPTYKPGENPNSLKNLLPRPPAGAARKGAYAANKAKKRKRQMREAVEYLLTLPVQGGSKPQKLKYILEAKTKNLTVIEAMVVAQIKKAVNGDTKAFNALLDTYGKQQLETPDTYESTEITEFIVSVKEAAKKDTKKDEAANAKVKLNEEDDL